MPVVTVTVIKEGYDINNAYWTVEAFQKIADRYTIWRQQNPDSAMGVSWGLESDDYIGHIDSMWYDPVSRSLKAAVDPSSNQVEGLEPEEILAQDLIRVVYRVKPGEYSLTEHQTPRIHNAKLESIIAFGVQQGLRPEMP